MTAYLHDTNVLSEVTKPSPQPAVLALLASGAPANISVMSVQELQFGICRLPEGRRRLELQTSLNRLVVTFQQSILPVSRAVATRAGCLRCEALTKGQTVQLADALIAATALEHGLTLVTRNVSDFAHLGLQILDPWHP